MPQQTIAQFERLIRRDPARRGLVGTEQDHGPLCPQHLHSAAMDLANHGTGVVIVTGLFISRGVPPAAETDGPLGAVFLATALEKLGIETTILTDQHCLRAVQVTARAAEFPETRILAAPSCRETWCRSFFKSGPGRRLTHLIAVERIGPSHTLKSLDAQQRETTTPREEFTAAVSDEHHDRCHNISGQIIDEHTADLHRLFEEVHQYRPDVKTIGIGDGGNEIGMGSIPWEQLYRRLAAEHAGRIPCRITTDWTIIAGTSNWGAYALAASVLLIRGELEHLRGCNAEQQLHVLQHTVQHGPAVDGITLRQEPTVDGLPFTTYIQPWEGMRKLLGFDH